MKRWRKEEGESARYPTHAKVRRNLRRWLLLIGTGAFLGCPPGPSGSDKQAPPAENPPQEEPRRSGGLPKPDSLERDPPPPLNP
jgi:hypothetical protein